MLNDLFRRMKSARPADAAEIKDIGDSPSHTRRQNMRKSIKNMLLGATKFAKCPLKRGIYFSCLLYHADKVVVTSGQEEYLPTVEVDENLSGTPGSFQNDFHWLMKVACTWDDVRALRQDMEKTSSSSQLHLRSKLLNASLQLQNGLGVQDLGQLFYKPIKDEGGTTVIVSVQYVKDPKTIQAPQLKWTSLSKVQKKLTPTTAATTTTTTSTTMSSGSGGDGESTSSSTSSLETSGVAAMDRLMSGVPEMIVYHQVSTIPLPRGLYLGYIKLKSTVDLIRLMVPSKKPNVLPHVKIRDNPHVARDEWSWLHRQSQQPGSTDPAASLELQQTFRHQVISASKRLLQMMGVEESAAGAHRLYHPEVVDMSPDVSFVLLMPSEDDVCAVPGAGDDKVTSKDGHVMLPVQIFEVIHMATYRQDFINRYTRLSSILELDQLIAVHNQREAFSDVELSEAKERVELLQQFQKSLEDTWKGVRWTMDVLTRARDKHQQCGVTLAALLAPHPSPASRRSRHAKTDANSNTRGAADRNRRKSTDKSGAADGPGGILRIYAAYPCGLAKGTNVKLHVTSKTTSREVINLVVQQLNKAAKVKGKHSPNYSAEQLDNFVLVAVIGARERCLRDDYPPLELQSPWVQGRLFVRMKENVLAALDQQGSAVSVV